MSIRGPFLPGGENQTPASAIVTSAELSAAINNATIRGFYVVSTKSELSLAMANKYLRTEGTTAIELNVPTCASVAIPIGSQFMIRQAGTGQITVSAITGASISRITSGSAQSSKQHATMFLLKVGSDTWDLWGDVSTT